MDVRTRGVAVFLLLSFGLAWGGMFTAAALGMSLVNPLVQLATIAFTPAIAAVVVRVWVTKEGFADAGLAVRVRSAWPYYLAAGLGPLGLVAATAGLAAILGLWTPDLSALDLAVPGVPGWLFVVLLVAAMPLLAPLFAGEELGWTSYLRMRVFPGRPVAATVATGLIWAVWHYPLAFLGYIEFGNVVLGLLVWTVSFLLQEIVLSWLWLNSGTVWTASLAHAGNNLVWSLLNSILLTEAGGVDDFVVMLVGTVPLAALCGWIVLSGRLRADRTGRRGGARLASPNVRAAAVAPDAGRVRSGQAGA
ncbi:CPBP family intramembrane metalloprotease [Marinitenerispora sediminis]|uniref:CPBP family intramembrane metalloprotease n=2 Tax=Marinitenerispora sediminis TaxID=1931232 RepID=A0A368T339_9ACTN|nr:CPBP family intramembrane metalloprotease [Marinitenerispora sediminis]RCV52493.1 CPBP family intramembrane metalloprotease [Marinitenerispora sediminis]RCV56649.1 CPBP family intramembrane metalloprotease [Marinitenerispora sediminis]